MRTSRLLLLTLPILTLISIYESSAVTFPSTGPSGSYSGGSFGTYFQRMISPCPVGQVVIGFSTGTSTYGQISCATESDPEVGANTASYLSKWNGSQLVTSQIYDNTVNVGIGTSSPGEKLDVAGDIRATNIRTKGLTRTLPTVVNDAVDIGGFAFTNGGGVLKVSIVVPSSGFSVSKTYMIPVNYGETAGAWTIVQPFSDAGVYSGNNYDLDINVNAGTASLRIRRTVGSSAGTAYIYMEQIGINTDIFTTSSTTASVVAPSTFYPATSIRQVDGNVGIGTASPGATLDINGTIRIAGGSPGVGKVLISDASGIATWQTFSTGSSSSTSLTGTMVGTTNYVAKYDTATDLGNSQIYDDGTNVGIGTASPQSILQVQSTSPTLNLIGPSGNIAFRMADSPTSGTRKEFTIVNDVGNNRVDIQAIQQGVAARNITLNAGGGNVSIGTTSTSGLLTVSGSIAAMQDAYINGVRLGKGGGSQSLNTTLGNTALNLNTTGNGNTALGANSLASNSLGSNNTTLGYFAGSNLTAGDSNIFIGYNAQPNIGNTSSNQLNIGNWIYGNAGNIGIGVLNPAATLDVNGTIKIGGGSPGLNKFLTSDAAGLASWVVPSTTNISEGTNLFWTSARFDTAFAGKTTANLTENTNLYFTSARAQAAMTGAASTIAIANLTASRALASDVSGKVAVSAVTTTELGYLGGVTGAIQTQLNGKEPTITAGTTAQYWRGDKSWQTLNTAGVPELTNLYYTAARARTALTSDAGTTNYLVKFNGTSTIANSQLFDNGTNVGIGTATPGAKLDVAGDIYTTLGKILSDGVPSFNLRANRYSYLKLSAIDNTANVEYPILQSAGGDIQLFTANSEKIRISNAGNLGIGTTSPSAPLTVSGAALVTGNLTVQGSVITDKLVNRTVTNISISGSIMPDSAAPAIYRDIGSAGQPWNNLYLGGQATATQFNGSLNGNATTATTATNSNQLGGVAAASYALLASPALSGTPTAPTAPNATNTTQIATTAFVKNQGYLTSYTETDPVWLAQKSGYATLASPILTGDPTGPTPLTADNDTSLSTTAFVKAQGYLTSYSETDPEVGANTTNYLSKWNGSALVTSQLFDNGTSIGIGTSTGTFKLEVAGGDILVNSIRVGRGGSNVATNTVVGTGTLAANTSGNANTAIGYRSLLTNTSGAGNTAVGASALQANLGGDQNTALGYLSLTANTTGMSNVAIGYQSLSTNTGGIGNTVVGATTLTSSKGDNNLALGNFVGSNLTSGSNNILIGNSIYAPTASSSNTLNIGNLIYGNGVDGFFGTLSTGNIGIGVANPTTKLDVNGQIKIAGGSPGLGKVLTSDAAGLATWQTVSYTETDPEVGANTSTYIPKWNGTQLVTSQISDNGTSVTMTGDAYINGVRTGRGGGSIFGNTVLGAFGSLGSVTTGSYNTAVGNNTLSSVTTGSSNTAVGVSALSANLTNENTAVGYNTLTTTTSGYRNTAIGSNALQYNTTGQQNAAVSSYALQNNATGSYNTAVGNQALLANISGNYNTANGQEAGVGLTSGNNNLFLGWNTAPNIGTTSSNQINIANLIYGRDATGAGAGNIGIGVANPGYKLDVAGTVNATAFRGDGSALTALTAANISAGTASISISGNALTATTAATANAVSFNGGLTTASSPTFAGLSVSGNQTVNGDLTIVGKVVTDTLVNRTVAQLTVSGSIFPFASSSQKDLGATGNRWANLWLSGNADVGGSVTAGSFVGNGASLTSLNPTNISAGTAGINISGTATNSTQLGGVAAASYALLASPALSGTPTAPTAAVSTNTTQLASTAFVLAQVANDAPTKVGGGASGTWGINVTGNAATATNATTASSAPLVSALADYSWTAGTLPASYPKGIQSSFVQAANGFQNYGSVMNMSTYSAGGGGALQLYTPYSPTYGGTGLQVRFGNYDAGNAWTTWKTLLASDNFNTYAPTLTGGGASGTWGINISGNAQTATTATTATNANFVNSPDGDRNAATKLPTTSPLGVRFDFVQASTANGGGNFAGLMTYAPWAGTTASTGDASYQLAFNSTAANGGGIPYLSLRKGIDSTWNSWYTMLHSGNFNTYAPTLTGGGASGTWGIGISGNAATATTATTATNVTALAGTWDGTNYFRSNKGAASTVGANSTYGLEAYSSDGGAAGMSFHRGGVYAVNMGLDPDNVLRIGGWSAPANRWQLDMSGNNTIAGQMTAANVLTTPVIGNGLCLWQDCTNYKISMGAGADYYYGPVTDYSIKSTMSNTAGRGWTWGTPGAVPVAALNTAGTMQIAGTMSIGGATQGGTLNVNGGRTYLTAGGEQYGLGVKYLIGGGTVYFGASNSTATPDALVSNNAGSEIIRFANSGNVGIGATVPNRKLDIGVGGGGDGLTFGQDTDDSATIQFYLNGQWSNRTTYAGGCCNLLKIQPDIGKTQIGSSTNAQGLDVYGTTYIRNGGGYGSLYAGAYYYASDKSWKQDIAPLDSALEKVLGLQGVSFKWKDTGRSDIGFIAQDVEKVVPEIVATDKDGKKSLEYGNISALTVEAIKEQQKIIEAQKLQIDSLEKRLEKIEAALQK